MRLALLSIVSVACATTATSHADEGPVVIELFTSQGCSSCPSAEAYVNKLAKSGSLGGRQLAPLVFHVDYWNDLGWPDPFSTPAWTERQHGYARALGDRSVYTPELVVAGGAGMVGSQVSSVERAVAAAPKQMLVAASATWQPKQVAITATAPDGAEAWVAIYQEATKTKVTRGENSGETLASERVVRELRRIAPAGTTATVTIALDGSWVPAGAVVLAQRGDRHIIGARLLPVSR